MGFGRADEPSNSNVNERKIYDYVYEYYGATGKKIGGKGLIFRNRVFWAFLYIHVESLRNPSFFPEYLFFLYITNDLFENNNNNDIKKKKKNST